MIGNFAAGFGALALVIACIGLYGLTVYILSRRTGEFGLRMAVGAERQDILRLALGQGATRVASGIVIGLIAASPASRLFASLLYGVSDTDAITYLSVAALLALVALIACCIPARRAAHVDPMVALRYE